MKKRKMGWFLLCLLCLIPFRMTATASQTGSLRIVGIDGPVCLHHVATPDGTLTEAFADAPVDLSQPEKAAENARNLSEYVLAHSVSGTERSPDESGEVLFTPLEEGFYLVYSLADQVEFTPFLVQIPTQINERIIYHIQAEPKEEEPTEPTNVTEPPRPTEPDPEIPQTGNSVWPKYLLMTLGSAAVLMGLIDLIRGREKAC